MVLGFVWSEGKRYPGHEGRLEPTLPRLPLEELQNRQEKWWKVRVSVHMGYSDKLVYKVLLAIY